MFKDMFTCVKNTGHPLLLGSLTIESIQVVKGQHC